MRKGVWQLNNGVRQKCLKRLLGKPGQNWQVLSHKYDI